MAGEEHHDKKQDKWDKRQGAVVQKLPRLYRTSLRPVCKFGPFSDSNLVKMLQILCKRVRRRVTVLGIAFEGSIENLL
jgi:hypothetical protein